MYYQNFFGQTIEEQRAIRAQQEIEANEALKQATAAAQGARRAKSALGFGLIILIAFVALSMRER